MPRMAKMKNESAPRIYAVCNLKFEWRKKWRRDSGILEAVYGYCRYLLGAPFILKIRETTHKWKSAHVP